MTSAKPQVSVFIQTLNEEENIAACLECFSWCDDIVVLDSFSSDRTEEISKTFGVRWIQHEYKGRAAHQNWAMESIEFKHPWVYYSDADERVPPELIAEIAEVTANGDPDIVAYRVNRRDYFMDKWIPRSTGYPLKIVRLFKPGKIRWERKANPIAIVDGGIGELKNDYLHFTFSKGLRDWINRQNRTTSFEAEELIKSLNGNEAFLKELISSDPVIRKKALKTASFRMPARPILRFVYQYFFKLGVLDGIAGFHYCVLISIYEYLIDLKVKELRLNEKKKYAGQHEARSSIR